MLKKGLIVLLVPVLASCVGVVEVDCIPPYDDFSEADLIGTWYTGLEFRNDTLIFREDNLYKQIIHNESQAFDYESDWQRWWIEYTDIGNPYIHLEGMRMCVNWPDIDCDVVGGGDGKWIDFCRDQRVQIPGEGVLIVLGTPGETMQPSRGFILAPYKKSFEVSPAYRPIEP